MVLQITPSERALLESLAKGGALADIARRFGTNEHQIDVSLQALFARLGFHTSTSRKHRARTTKNGGPATTMITIFICVPDQRGNSAENMAWNRWGSGAKFWSIPAMTSSGKIRRWTAFSPLSL